MKEVSGTVGSGQSEDAKFEVSEFVAHVREL